MCCVSPSLSHFGRCREVFLFVSSFFALNLFVSVLIEQFQAVLTPGDGEMGNFQKTFAQHLEHVGAATPATQLDARPADLI